MNGVLTRLETVIAMRKAEGDAATSHTAAMLAKGPLKCAQKFGEEAVEAVVAASAESDEALVAECADAIYHMALMLASRDLSILDVLAELERREGVSGVAEKAGREAGR